MTEAQRNHAASSASRRAAYHLLTICALAACSNDGITPAREPDPSQLVTVDIPFCSAAVPSWVAFQDGDGAWTRALPLVEGQKTRFRYAFNSDRGAVAIGRIFALGRVTGLSVQYGKPEELIIAADTSALHCGPSGTRTLLGTAAGIDTNELAAVTAGFGSGALLAPDETDFSLQGLAPGPQDILARRFSRVNDTRRLTSIILRRTSDLPDSARLAQLDFNSAEAFSPVLATATLGGIEVDSALVATGLLTPLSQGFLGPSEQPAAGNRRTIVAIPAERLRDGDLQIVTVSAVAADFSRRSASAYFRASVDQTLTLGAPATTPTVSSITMTPSLRLRAAFDAQPEYDRLTSIAFVQDQTTVTIAATAAYARLAAAGYDLVMPDLSSVAGFDPRWALRANEPVFWNVSRVGGTLGLGVNAQPFAGATVRTGDRFGTFNP